MIIDARTQSHEKFRKHTVIGAVAHVLENMGDEIVIDEIFDAAGRKKTINQLRMSTAKLKDEIGINYMTRVLNGKLHIFKIT